MSDQAGLFEVPDEAYILPPPPEELSRGERRARLVAGRIAQGQHPLGKGIRLHPEAKRDRDGGGLRCGTCRFRKIYQHHDKSYPKCVLPFVSGGRTTYPRDTGCESSDIRAWWPACRDYQQRDTSE